MSSYKSHPLVPILSVFGSITFLCLGTSLAKHTLFPLFGAQGTTAIRVGFSALLLLAVWRPWRQAISRTDAGKLICYGVALGLLNLCFYLSLRTIPFGVAVAIEFSGPLAVALFSSRRPLDFAWILVAVMGLGLLLPMGHTVSELDPVGVMYALAAAVFWAGYILCGRRMEHLHAGHSVALGLAVAALVVVPVGLPYIGTALFSPWVLAVGLCVAIASSAIPFSLEMIALKRLPPQAFGVMISMEPALAALLALVLLDERLSSLQWLAIGLIALASAGSSVTVRRTENSSPGGRTSFAE
ncbi:DMT family transporter [Massilia sp. CFBP9012]|uniref:DMT family transporter n=1 Tax=Massilia sp. CFBP9012 TaxID=3096531 RepID=UPI002A69EC27|nr:DMT family transporter [Massilia sp. CFBP9012]MDY0978286.1 DMT family transporter [Massilia sp. CFBP9012]